MSDNGGPAFPLPVTHVDGTVFDTAEYCPKNIGLSILDYFAAKALPNAIASTEAMIAAVPEMARAASTDEGRGLVLGRVASMAYDMAVAMLEEKKRREA